MGYMLVHLPKPNTQQQVNIVSQIFTSQSDLPVCSHLSWRDAHISIQHLRELAREEQSSCLLKVSRDRFNSQFIKAIFLCFFVIRSLSASDPFLYNENSTASLILQFVVLRCNFSRTGMHSNNMVGSTITLILSTNWSVYAYISPTFKQTCC